MKKPTKEEVPPLPDIFELPDEEDAFVEELLKTDLRTAFERMAGVAPKPTKPEVETPTPRKKSA